MSLTGDGPDFQQVVGGGGTILVNTTSNPAGTGPGLINVYVGAWDSLTIHASCTGAGGQLWQLFLTWFLDSTFGVSFLGGIYETEASSELFVSVPVIAPYLQLNFGPHPVIDNGGMRLTVIGVRTAQPALAGSVVSQLVEDVGRNIAGGANVANKPARIMQGLCTLTVQTTVTTWHANVQRLDENGAFQGVVAALDGAGSIARSVQLALPPRRVRVFTQNDAAGAAVFNTTLTISKQA